MYVSVCACTPACNVCVCFFFDGHFRKHKRFLFVKFRCQHACCVVSVQRVGGSGRPRVPSHGHPRHFPEGITLGRDQVTGEGQ